MKVKVLFSAIASFGIIALSSLPAFARDAILVTRFADSTVNLRATPSVSAPLRGVGVAGEQVRILTQTRVGSNRNLWYLVQAYNTGAEGWVDGTYVQPIGGGQGGPSYGGEMTVIDRNQRYLVDDHEVRVFPQGGQTRINVFNRRVNRTQISGEPVSVRRSSDGVTYTGRNVVFFVHNNGQRTLTMY